MEWTRRGYQMGRAPTVSIIEHGSMTSGSIQHIPARNDKSTTHHTRNNGAELNTMQKALCAPQREHPGKEIPTPQAGMPRTCSPASNMVENPQAARLSAPPGFVSSASCNFLLPLFRRRYLVSPGWLLLNTGVPTQESEAIK
jgi:hypothetical protein